MTSSQDPTVRDLVQRAVSDPAFATQMLDDPKSIASEYNLTDEQVAKIKDLADQGVFRAPVEAHGVTPAYY